MKNMSQQTMIATREIDEKICQGKIYIFFDNKSDAIGLNNEII